jgi:LCP family protein required for cell wall assembly
MPEIRTSEPLGGRHRPIRHPRSDGRRVFGFAAGGLSALLSATLFLAFGYGWYNFRELNAGTHHLALHNLVGGADQHAGETTDGVTGKTQNILLVGLDSRAGLSPAEQHRLHVASSTFTLSTDTIMVIHIPADGSKAKIISIPRDSYVDIPGGWAKNKINAAYADAYSQAKGSEDQKEAAGADLLIATVKKLTGLSIDHYVQVNFGGFYRIAKAIGKIPVNLCQSVDDTFAHNRATGQSGGSDFKMSAGHHDLNAVQALEFVRQRHNIHGGDYARVERQRYFLSAAFDRIASAGVLGNPFRLRSLIHAVNGAFYIDDGFSLLALAEQMSNLTGSKISGHTVPTKGTGLASVVGVQEDVDFVDPQQVRSFVAKVLSASSTGKHKHHKHHAQHRNCIY